MITTISIVEDDVKLAQLLKMIIDADVSLSVQGVYTNGTEALKTIPNTPTDVVLMDIQLPDYTGIELVSLLKKEMNHISFIMNTSFEEDDKIFESLKAGASGYMLKSDAPEKIIESIKEVISGGAPMSTIVAKKVIQFFNKPNIAKEKLENITEKENELLNLLSKGFLYKEIAMQMNIGIDTVKKHCGNIYKKLHVSNRTEAINIFLNR